MRFTVPLIAACAAVAVAQSSSGSAVASSVVVSMSSAASSAMSSAPSPANTAGACTAPNCFNTPSGGFQVTAGVPVTLTWANPSSGPKNIYLTQGGAVQVGTGILLASNIAPGATSATVTVPANVNFSQYNFQIVDQSNTSLINFSPAFAVQGATGAASSMSGSSMSGMSSTATGSSAMSTGSSASSAMSSASRSASSAASSASASASSALSSASRSASSAASSASMSATAAPTSGGVTFGANGVFAMIAAAVAFL